MRFLFPSVLVVFGWSCSASESSPGAASNSPSGGSSSGGAGPSTGGSVPATGGRTGTSTGGVSGAGTSTGGITSSSGGTGGPTGGRTATGGAGVSTGGAGAAPAGGAAGSATAGTPGAGGTAGGAVGGAGAGAGGGKTGGLGCSGTELLCEDFEDVAEGEVPTGDPWHALDASCEFQASSFTMGVTGALANGGTKSLKVTNKHFAQCRLSGQFEPVDEFWVRAYSYWETGLDISNRETLDIDLTPGFRTADDPAVRFGYRSKSPCEQFAGPQITIIGVAGGEATGCGSRAMPKGEWFCFEAHVQQSSTLTVATYIDGETLSYQSTGKPVSASISTESAISQKLDHIRLGIFSTGEAQGSIYLDDVAVSATRIGCAN